MIVVIALLCSSFSFISAYPKQNSGDQCLNYCLNGGICLMVDGNPKCHCLSGWDGERCDWVRIKSQNDSVQMRSLNNIQSRVDPCQFFPNHCKNAGVCNFDYSTNAVKCICNFLWSGAQCELPSPCRDFCQNDGVCQLDTAGVVPTCKCGQLFTGARCETKQSSPSTDEHPVCTALGATYCNGGTCFVAGGKILCLCQLGKTGATCNEVIPTSLSVPGGTNPGTNPAGGQNPGTNQAGGQNPGTGNAPSTFPACLSSPCKNGACFNDGNTFFCECNRGFSGKDCSTSSG